MVLTDNMKFILALCATAWRMRGRQDAPNDKDRKSTQTQVIGGDRSVTRCLHTFITTRNPPDDGRVVTAIREPPFDCAIGDLS